MQIDPEKIRQLVKDELERQLTGKQNPVPSVDPTLERSGNSILVILTGSDILLDDVMSQLELLSKRYTLTVVPTQGFCAILSTDELRRRLPGAEIVEQIGSGSIRDFIAGYKSVLIPLFSMNTLAKVALGIQDSIAPILIINALLQNKPVLALNEGITQYIIQDGKQPSTVSGEAEPPAWSGVMTADAALTVGIPHRHPATHISGLYKGYLRTLEKWGIRFVEAIHLSDETIKVMNPNQPPPKPVSSTEHQPKRRQVITRDDLWELHRTGDKEIRVAANAIITDIAKDYARDNGITIIVEGE